MPDERTVLKRAYFVIVLSMLVSVFAIATILSSSPEPYSPDEPFLEKVYVASPSMLYYPAGDDSLSVFLDETLVNKEASEPVVKTDEDRINEYVSLICDGYSNVTPELIQSVIMSESSYNPNARNGNHVGLMQVSQRWHRERASNLGVEDLYDPYGNILVGVDYLDELIDSTNGDRALALMIYNMGAQKAYQLYSNGHISSYASTILSRI